MKKTIHLCADAMKRVGKKYKTLSFTDDELSEQICALELTIAYLKGREDADIVTKTLAMNLDMLRSMALARSYKPNSVGIHWEE